MNAALVLRGMLTCPECCQRTIETMPLNACIWFYDCPGCGTTVRPKAGDCAFCSYGSVPCPPMQQARDCCRPAS
jgi:hypothetical protein